ncbi:hypothetical protein PAAL109150_26750 [Paenibacillus alkaliterrae]
MTRDGTAHLGIHRLNSLYLSHIRNLVSFEELQGDKPLNSEFKQGHEWEPKSSYYVLSAQNMGLSNGGDPYGNGVFIVSNVAVVMMAAQADSNMCRWIIYTAKRVTKYAGDQEKEDRWLRYQRLGGMRNAKSRKSVGYHQRQG